MADDFIEGDGPERAQVARLAGDIALSYDKATDYLTVTCTLCERKLATYIGLEYGERAKREGRKHHEAEHAEG